VLGHGGLPKPLGWECVFRSESNRNAIPESVFKKTLILAPRLYLLSAR